MKNKLICVVLAIATLIVSFILQSIEPEKNRYHQHEETRPKAACTDHGEDVFCTHLPLLNITTDDEIPSPYVLDEQGNRGRSDEMIGATIQYFDSDAENNHLTDIPVFIFLPTPS